MSSDSCVDPCRMLPRLLVALATMPGKYLGSCPERCVSWYGPDCGDADTCPSAAPRTFLSVVCDRSLSCSAELFALPSMNGACLEVDFGDAGAAVEMPPCCWCSGTLRWPDAPAAGCVYFEILSRLVSSAPASSSRPGQSYMWCSSTQVWCRNSSRRSGTLVLTMLLPSFPGRWKLSPSHCCLIEYS